MEVFQSAPLTRGETIGGRSLAVLVGISIHSPHTRGDDLAVRDLQRGFDFNPLPSHEGRLAARCVLRVDARGISIHSPHTRGDIGQRRHHRHPLISIHSHHARGDCRWTDTGRTSLISIHSPHTRGDQSMSKTCPSRTYFNPLPSHEGRQHKPPKIHSDLRQLTQQNHDTPLFGALQAPFCGAEPDIRGAKPTGKP